MRYSLLGYSSSPCEVPTQDHVQTSEIHNNTSGIIGGAILTAKVADKVLVVSFMDRANMASAVKS
jgi:hypothetical protein